MKLPTLDHLNFANQKTLVRLDLNVPLDAEQNIVDETRIRAALPTIKAILAQGGSLIIMSHLGRPKGKVDPKYSLKPCAEALGKLLGQEVQMAPDCIGEQTRQMAENLEPGQVLLLENLRFHEAETKPEKDPSFAKELATLADLYVNDAFGTAHRKHSSTYTLCDYFNHQKAAGLLMEKEVHFLTNAFEEPKRPFYALVGGAKISTKLGVIYSLLSKVDALFIGGAMAYTFFKAQGISIGTSLFEPNLVEEANRILELSKQKQIPLYLPQDIVCVQEPALDAPTQIFTPHTGIADGYEGVDIGPKTIALYCEKFSNAKTFFWNGPVGLYEMRPFAQGTRSLLAKVAQLSASTIIGGGDLVAACQATGASEKMTHISTGGGACLELIEKGTLPTIQALLKK